jgi:hypothetical protein
MKAVHAPLNRRSALAALSGLTATLRGHAASAQTHALLVGVGQVAALPKRLWLRGPANDVELMRLALQARGASARHIVCLSQNPGDAAPTQDAITQAMQALMQRAQPGDQVVLHLAGHGVQVPQRPGAPAEPDGLDEVFLAADTQPWNGPEQRLPQGLYDHDIGAWLVALSAKGCRVLAVLDTCHAAGLHRGNGSFTRQRGVAAAELGVPRQARPNAHYGIYGLQQAPLAPGLVLALAARGHESTPEEWLPKAAPQARLHGVFTHAVVQALRQGAADAAALRLAVAGQYAAAGRSSPVPMVLGQGAILLG